MSSVIREIEALRKNWGWLLLLGVLQAAIGGYAMVHSFTATVTTVVLFGAFLVAGAVIQGIYSFWARDWAGFFMLILLSVLQGVAGCFMLGHPIKAAEELTLFLAALILVGGIFKVIASVSTRFPNWGWVFLNGLVSILLGAMLYRQYPLSGLWFIGFCVGLELLTNGFCLAMFALAIKSRFARV